MSFSFPIKKNILLLWGGLGLVVPGFGQLTVTFPYNRAVFQRDNNNQAAVYVAGNLTDCYADRIEARLLPVASGGGVGPNQGTDTGWQPIAVAPQGSLYGGSLTSTGGWYELRVRAIRNNATLGNEVLAGRVGIGEVFVIAGQSNACGDTELNNRGNYGLGAAYEQVSTIEFNHAFSTIPGNYSTVDEGLPCPAFTFFSQTVRPSPFGNSAWYWGAVGDRLVEQWQVPVAFFQAGWSGSSSYDWANSSDNLYAPNQGVFVVMGEGMPFANLRIAINHYATQFGLRAVLWHQGEMDNYINTPQATYKNNLQHAIEQSRSQTGRSTLAWMVAVASRIGEDLDGSVIAAQQEVIGSVPGVYAGPYTDPIANTPTTAGVRESDNVHFTGNGHNLAAQAWADRLAGAFLASTTPVMPHQAFALPLLEVACAGPTQLTLTGPGGAASYRWLSPATNCQSTLATGPSATFGQGSYVLQMRNPQRDAVLSARFDVPAQAGFSSSLTASGNTPLSAGNTLALQAAATACRFSWDGPGGFSSLQQNPTIANIQPPQAGTYTVTAANVYNCTAQASVSVTVISQYVSGQSGEWTNPSTWQSNCAGCLPTAATGVRIQAGHTVTVPAGTTVPARSLQLEGILNLLLNSQVMLHQ